MSARCPQTGSFRCAGQFILSGVVRRGRAALSGESFAVAQRFSAAIQAITPDAFSRWGDGFHYYSQPRSGAIMQPTAQAVGNLAIAIQAPKGRKKPRHQSHKYRSSYATLFRFKNATYSS